MEEAKLEGLFPPEGPEVKLISDFLKKDLMGEKLKEFFVYPESRYKGEIPGQSLLPKNCNILDIKTRGKNFYFKFSEDCYLYVEPRISGKFQTFEDKSCFKIVTKNKEIFFNDYIHYGVCSFINKEQLNNKLYEICFDPIEDSIDSGIDKVFKFTRKNKKLSSVLFNLRSIAGIGTSLKSEILYKAKISPHSYARDLTRNHIRDFCEMSKELSTLSYKSGGSIVYRYSESECTTGNFYDHCSVFMRKRDKLNNKVVYSVIYPDKNSIFWVKEVQELL